MAIVKAMNEANIGVLGLSSANLCTMTGPMVIKAILPRSARKNGNLHHDWMPEQSLQNVGADMSHRICLGIVWR